MTPPRRLRGRARRGARAAPGCAHVADTTLPRTRPRSPSPLCSGRSTAPGSPSTRRRRRRGGSARTAPAGSTRSRPSRRLAGSTASPTSATCPPTWPPAGARTRCRCSSPTRFPTAVARTSARASRTATTTARPRARQLRRVDHRVGQASWARPGRWSCSNPTRSRPTASTTTARRDAEGRRRRSGGRQAVRLHRRRPLELGAVGRGRAAAAALGRRAGGGREPERVEPLPHLGGRGLRRGALRARRRPRLHRRHQPQRADDTALDPASLSNDWCNRPGPGAGRAGDGDARRRTLAAPGRAAVDQAPGRVGRQRHGVPAAGLPRRDRRSGGSPRARLAPSSSTTRPNRSRCFARSVPPTSRTDPDTRPPDRSTSSAVSAGCRSERRTAGTVAAAVADRVRVRPHGPRPRSRPSRRTVPSYHYRTSPSGPAPSRLVLVGDTWSRTCQPRDRRPATAAPRVNSGRT